MKKILSVFMALCTVLTTLCIPPAPAVAQSTEPLASAQIEEAITLPIEEEPISLETLTEDCKILQYVDEEAFAAADHAFRLPYLEELDTYVFQNTDGTRSIYYLYENVKYIDEQGNIREKDNTLQREIKGFRITENEFDLLLPHAITDGVELTYQGYDVKLIPATEGKLTATALGTLRENSVVYESFFGAGTSLVYTPLLSGVKEEIILEEYLPNKTFSFLLYTDGLFLNNTDGSYILTESKSSSEAVLYLGDIVVYDAVGRPSLGNLTVETVKDGNIYALTVSADEAFLSDPATVYPVTIDPDLTISDANNGSGAIEDTTLFSGTPNLNTGNWVYNTAGYADETYGAGRILVRLPGLYNDAEYTSLTADQITSATFYVTKSSSKTPDYVNLYLCTDTGWSENSVAWNYHANLYTNSTNWGTSSVSSSAVSFNITTLVKAWRSGTYSAQAGFMLINQNETDVTKKFGIYSSEYSNNEKRPYVVLTYEDIISFPIVSSSILIDTTYQILPTVYPSNATVYWSVGDADIATVSTSGTVTALRLGETKIYAQVIVEGTLYTASYTLYVRLANGTYYFNSERTSKYLNNNNGTPNGYSAAFSLVEESAGWQLIYQGGNTYLIRSCQAPYYYLAEGTSTIDPGLSLISMTGAIQNRCLWTITSGESFGTVRLKSNFGRELFSTDDTASFATLSVDIQPMYSGEWRYENALRMTPLTVFGVNTNEVECYKTKRFQVQLDTTEYSFVRSSDFSYVIRYGSAYISLSGGFFSDLTGRNVGTAQIEVTYKVSNQKIMFPMKVNPYSFKVGISADAYTDGQHHKSLGTDLYSSAFFDKLSFKQSANISKSSLVRHINGQAFGNASKMDFETISNPNGAIADQVDFMVYMGHALAADREGSGLSASNRQKGNYLHYYYTGDGVIHDNTGCYTDAMNLYTSEARFSHPRWVWLYTCNFLHESEYVTQDELIAMMDGTHILMGYETQSYLSHDIVNDFASELSKPKSIINAFFIAGDKAEAKGTKDHHIQKVLYVAQARYETIFSIPVTYSYTADDILILTNGIHDDVIWE